MAAIFNFLSRPESSRRKQQFLQGHSRYERCYLSVPPSLSSPPAKNDQARDGLVAEQKPEKRTSQARKSTGTMKQQRSTANLKKRPVPCSTTSPSPSRSFNTTAAPTYYSSTITRKCQIRTAEQDRRNENQPAGTAKCNKHRFRPAMG